ncbi:hypothetical protein BH10ACI4_BH10ACI4_38900 [soil metagenome]
MGKGKRTDTKKLKRRNVELRPRDYHLLEGLFESRLMTLKHAAVLYFDGKAEAAKKRIQKLKAAGYIRERERRVRERSILCFTQKGFDALRENGVLDRYPRIGWHKLRKRAQVGSHTIAHELAVMDVKAAFVQAIAAAAPALSIVEFSTWPALHRFQAYRPDGIAQAINPDGFIRIIERVEADGVIKRFQHTLFLEVDKSSEVQEVLGTKAFCYRDYYRRGGLALRNGKLAAEFEKFPFRVLFVMKSRARLENTARTLVALRPPLRSQVWLTTLEDVVRDPLARIWITPNLICDQISHSAVVNGPEGVSARTLFDSTGKD